MKKVNSVTENGPFFYGFFYEKRFFCGKSGETGLLFTRNGIY